jgi:hypothetical protein
VNKKFRGCVTHKRYRDTRRVASVCNASLGKNKLIARVHTLRRHEAERARATRNMTTSAPVINLISSDEECEECMEDEEVLPPPTQRSSRQHSKSHPLIGSSVWVQLPNNSWSCGEVLEVQPWHGSMEPRVKLGDGHRLWCPVWSEHRPDGRTMEAEQAAKEAEEEEEEEGEGGEIQPPPPKRSKCRTTYTRINPPKNYKAKAKAKAIAQAAAASLSAVPATQPARYASASSSSSSLTPDPPPTHAKAAARPASARPKQYVRSELSQCSLLGCSDPAVSAHPMVVGLLICERHHTDVSRVPARTKAAPCQVTGRSFGSCRSMGCHPLYRRPCFLCGGEEAAADAFDGAVTTSPVPVPSSLSPCQQPGCTAFVHDACRDLLARRVRIHWPRDRASYWGTLASLVPFEDEDGDRFFRVNYDDGNVTDEEADDVESGRLVGSSTSASICICTKGVAVAESLLVSSLHACSVCCALETNAGSEHGMTNEMVYCDGCGLSVHIFCYGQTSAGEEFKRSQSVKSMSFLCDVCDFTSGGGDVAKLTCELCPRQGGVLRRQADGTWAHVACMQFHIQVEWPQVAEGHNQDGEVLCARSSGCGACLKSNFVLKPRRRGKAKSEPAYRCSAADCPDPTAGELAICGGQSRKCRRATHVSCGQRLGSGWHLLDKELQETTTIETLCDACSDLELDVVNLNAAGNPKYRKQPPPQSGALERYVSDEAYAHAQWTFADGFCGAIGGVRRAAERLGGVCVGACDSNKDARLVYQASFTSPQPPLGDITEMGSDARVLRSSDIFFATFCCKPFSQAGKGEGLSHKVYGNNLELLISTLKERRQRHVLDSALIVENVPNMLNKVTSANLEELGYHFRCYVVSGELFRCANVRERLILVGFLSKAHLDAFSPPPPQCDEPTPLRSELKHYDVESAHHLFVRPDDLAKAKKDRHVHVVGRGWPRGASSPTGSYGNITGIGTLVCVDPRFDKQTTKLTLDDLRRCDFGCVRRMHVTETLASMSFKSTEMPSIWSEGFSRSIVHELVAQTVCVNVIEAFAAEALAAMGIDKPREELRARVQRANSGRELEMGPLDGWSTEGVSETGVPRRMYKRFPNPAQLEKQRRAAEAAAAAAAAASSSSTALVAWSSAMKLVDTPCGSNADYGEDFVLDEE